MRRLCAMLMAAVLLPGGCIDQQSQLGGSHTENEVLPEPLADERDLGPYESDGRG